jgi:hypothetical protein
MDTRLSSISVQVNFKEATFDLLYNFSLIGDLKPVLNFS